MCAAKVEVLTAAACSGKTQALVARVRDLLACGAAPADVLVVTPNADGALELAIRLAANLDDGCVPRVVSWRRLAHELAGSPRVLGATERALLLADLRAEGFSAEDVACAQRKASAMWAGKEGFSSEEDDACLKALLGALAERAAVLPESLVAHALDRVASVGEGEACVAHVLVDDADAVPFEALRLASRLAHASLFLAGDAERMGVSHADGDDSRTFLSFAGDEGAHVLPRTSRRMNATRSQAVKWGDAGEEAAGVTALVDRRLSGAHVGEGPVALVVPNRPWARRISQSLAKIGVEVCDMAYVGPLACDPRDPKGCAPLRCFAALGLLADRGDAASWRTWCSLGYADLGAAAWANLRAHAASQDKGIVQALQDACAEVDAGRVSFSGARQLAARVHEAEGLFKACAATPRGFRLLEAIDPARTPAFRQLFPLLGDDLVALDAVGLFTVAQRSAFDPSFGMAPVEAYGARVHGEIVPLMDKRAYVCRPEALVGLRPRLVVALGANEGLVDATQIGTAASTCADELVVSYIQRMPAEAARRLGASFHRTRVEAGDQVALLRPTSALESLGAEAPATMSGQQYCSSVLGLRP